MSTPAYWTREHWAELHLISAASLSRISYRLENDILAGDRTQANVFEHRASVIGAVFASVAFLESTANELFADVSDSYPEELRLLSHDLPPMRGLDRAASGKLARMWKLGIPRRASYSVLDKFEVALAVLDMPAFDRGAAPYQEVQLLVILRNEWIHYEPRWFRANEDQGKSQISKLHGRFQSALHADTGGRFSLHSCVCHACAEWSVNASLAFADEFFRRIGIEPEHDKSRGHFSTR